MRLWHYIQGTRKGKEAHRIEKEAMHDPFLADALEGFDSVKGDHVAQIEALRRQVHRKSKQKRFSFRVWSVAASLLIIAGTGIYLLTRIGEVEIPPAGQKDAYVQALEEEISAPPAAPDSISKGNVYEEVPIGALAVAPVLSHAKEQEKNESKVVTAAPVRMVEEDLSDPVDSMVDMAMGELEETLVEVAPVAKEKMTAGAVAKVVEAVTSEKQQKAKRTSSDRLGRVRGKVIDNEGEPLVGASVYVRGTQKGAVTDWEGNFEFDVHEGESINIQYVGYDPVMLMADATQEMQVVLNENRDMLSETVVVGYGVQKKKSIARKPKPVDGERAYQKYLKKSVRYPLDDECKDVKGEVVLTFLVNAQGRPYEIGVERSLCPSADEEAIRLVSEGPDWKSGTEKAVVTVRF